MSITWFIAAFGAFVAAIGLALWFGGRWFSKLLRRRNPNSYPLQRLSGTGLILYAALTVALLIGATVRGLAPQSAVGGFLNTPEGLGIGLILCIAGFSVAYAVLERCGYRFFKAEDDRAV